MFLGGRVIFQVGGEKYLDGVISIFYLLKRGCCFTTSSSSLHLTKKVEATQTDARDKPLKDVIIAGTHVSEVAEPYSVAKADADQ